MKGESNSSTVGMETYSATFQSSTNSDIENIADVAIECPLCMENLDIDDVNFFPCSCGYQVCRFCWHRLKNDENGLCPACRQPYPDSPIHFSPISIERVEELKKQKKKQKEKQKSKENNKLQNLSSIRVVQKNLLFVIGFSQRLSQDDLRKEFSKYGKILKMVINSSSAYVTYTRPEDAVAAIKSLNETHVGYTKNNSLRTGISSLRASLGTTKYCTHWLRNQTCPKQPDCMYLHELAEQEASFTKEEMQLGKHTEYEKRLIAYYLDVIAKEKENKSTNSKYNSTNTISISNDAGNTTETIDESSTKQQNTTQYNEDYLDLEHMNYYKGESDDNVHDSFINNEVDLHNRRTNNSKEYSNSPVTEISSNMKSTVAIKIKPIDSHSDTSSGNSSLSTTPNQTDPSSVFSNFSSSGLSASSSASSGTSLSCDDSSSNSSTPDNIQQQQHQTKSNDDNSTMGSISQCDESQKTDNVDDDDDLDFDPISLSSRALEDMLRSSISDNNSTNNVNSCGIINQAMENRTNTEQSMFPHFRSNGSSFGLTESLGSNVTNQQQMMNSSTMNLLSRNQHQFVNNQFNSNFNQQNLSDMFQHKLLMNCNQQSLASLGSNSFVGNGNGQFMTSPTRVTNSPQQQSQFQQLFECQMRSQQPQMMAAFMNQSSSGSGNQTNKLWQQNSLRQLLPNVNIKFQQQTNDANAFGFGSSSSFFSSNGGQLNQMNNNLMRQNQPPQLHSQLVNGLSNPNQANCVQQMGPSFWSSNQQQSSLLLQQKMLLQQQQQQQRNSANSLNHIFMNQFMNSGIGNGSNGVASRPTNGPLSPSSGSSIRSQPPPPPGF